MYSYIYDSFLNHRKYEKIISKIENEITDLEIKGKICRLTLLNTIKATIEDEIRKGATTIVIVGNDKTVTRALDAVAPKEITLGIIPIGKESDNQMAKLLGIPMEEESCKVLSSRIIKKLSLGKVNNSLFINNATIRSQNLTIECDQCYQIKLIGQPHEVQIFNPRKEIQEQETEISDTLVTEINSQTKGPLFKIFKPHRSQKSVFNIQRISINNHTQNIPIIIDGQKIIKSPAIIEKAPFRLKAIVGKNRMI